MNYKIVTYGCQMNVHESEKLAGLLERAGYSETDDAEKADVIVFNTCCIRDTAERRALGNIGVMKGLKRRRPDIILAVCGCMPQQKEAAERISARYPYVDIVLGTRNIAALPEEIARVRKARETVPPESGNSHGRHHLPVRAYHADEGFCSAYVYRSRFFHPIKSRFCIDYFTPAPPNLQFIFCQTTAPDYYEATEISQVQGK